MSTLEELANEIATLKAEKKYQDREIKELKEKVETLTVSFNGQALAIQDIKTDVRYMRDEFSSIKTYIEESKTQPGKELKSFLWKIATNLVWALIVYYFAVIKK